MHLSKRLQAVADMVTKGNRVADVGTDHAYVPIYLVEQGKIPGAIALDINHGPLNRAKEHIAENKLLNYIDTRLSNGLTALREEEADSLIIAGMGGGLIVRILTEGKKWLPSFQELILQPQSEIDTVRRFLYENSYQIIDESMILEEGKYYPMMKAVAIERFEGKRTAADKQQELYFKYGQLLLERKNLVLKQFLEKEYKLYTNLNDKLKLSSEAHILKRRKEIQLEMEQIRGAMQFYDSERTDGTIRVPCES